jgi:putative DNA primase/helicase
MYTDNIDIDASCVNENLDGIVKDDATAAPAISEAQIRRFLTIISDQAKRAIGNNPQPGSLSLSRLHPGGGPLVATKFEVGQIESMVELAVADSDSGHNSYIEGRTVLRAGRGKRGTDDETGYVIAMVLDSDADKGEAGNVPEGATLIVESSAGTGNKQYWFFLSEGATAADAAPIGKLIRDSVGADKGATGKISQPFRIAGTLNYPDAKKQKRGRVVTGTKILEHHPERLWTLTGLREIFEALSQPKAKAKAKPNAGAAKAKPDASGDESTLPADLLDTIKNGTQNADRSAVFFGVVAELKRLGWSSDDIVALFERYPGGISLKFAGRIRAETERAFGKIEADEKAHTLSIPIEDRPCYRVFTDWMTVEEHTDEPGGGKCGPGVWNFGYKIEKKNIYFTRTNICTPCYVDAETCDADGNSWGRLLRFVRRDGVWVGWPIPMAMLTATGDDLRKESTDKGMMFNPRKKTEFEPYVHSIYPDKRITCVKQVGWSGPSFVLPDRVYGPKADGVIFQPGVTVQAAYRCAGTFDGWREGVAAMAINNPVLMFGMSCAFVGPLLAKCVAENGGVHIVGDSSWGKTTVAKAAASVSGNPATGGGQVLSWRSTANGMEGVAALHNDGLLVLDEISQCDARDVGDIVYSLANGVGKQRSGRTGAARESTSWRTIMLSTGERSIVTAMAVAGETAKAGQEVRMLDINVKRKFGCWDDLHALADGAAFSNAINLAAATHYGHALRAYLEKLTGDSRDWPAELERFKRLLAFAATGEDGQVIRAAGRFALIAMAGELAAKYGVVPWPVGDAIKASAAMFQVWRGARLGGNREPHQIREAVAAFIDKHGASRFSMLRDSGQEDNATRYDRAGWKDENGLYLFIKDGMREALKGFDFNSALDVLVTCGALPPPKGKERAAPKKIPGHGLKRVYTIDPECLAA